MNNNDFAKSVVTNNDKGMKKMRSARRVPSRGAHGGPLACVMGEIDLVRALQVGGIPCAVTAKPGEPVRYSRGVERVIERVDAAVDPEGMLDRLLDFAATEPEPPVLFYDGDWDLLLVSRERDRLAASFRFVVADASLVESVVDKGLFQQFADRLGLPVPPARVIHAGESVPTDLGLRYPVIVKPLTRDHVTWRPVARTKAVGAGSRSALERTAAALGEQGLDVIVQESIPGGEDRIESYHVYMNGDGDIAAEFTGRKLRTFPAEYGYTTALVITNERDVRDVGRDIVRRIGLRGVAKLDFKRAPDGHLWLLDVNPRFNLWHYAGALAGVNLPLLVYCDIVGLRQPTVAPFVPGVRWCAPRHDLQAARAQGWGLVRWLRFAAGCNAISGFAAQDPFPLARAALARARGRLAAGVHGS
jgi:D-aspartate ligase